MLNKKRAYKKKFHYIYKTTCTVTNKYYYGMHSTDNLDDGYLGSGKHLWHSIRKHGKENHIKKIVEYLDSREELRKREREIVNEELLTDPTCMNLQLGGYGGWINEEHKWKNINAMCIAGQKVLKEKRENDPIWCKKISDDKKKLFKNMNAESKQKIIDSPRFKCKKHSDETKKKMSEADRSGYKNSQYGTCWITNGKENKKIFKGDNLPKGYRLGRKQKINNKL